MSKRSIKAGTTSNVLSVFIVDPTSSTGAGLTGLAYNTSGLTAYYKRTNGTASVAITLATIATLGTFATGGFKEVDATHLPGIYEFDPPDAAIATGAQSVTFVLQGAAGMPQVEFDVELPTGQVDLVNSPNATAITAILNAMLDLAHTIDSGGGGDTVRQAVRLILAATAGKLAGAGGATTTIRDTNDSVNRIVATVDTQGNRTSITYSA